jgi:hypothetical protein
LGTGQDGRGRGGFGQYPEAVSIVWR